MRRRQVTEGGRRFGEITPHLTPHHRESPETLTTLEWWWP